MIQEMRIPGVLGGLGPQTTADYYLRIQELARQNGCDERPPMLTWSVPLPYELEERSIFQGTGFDEIGDYLVLGAQMLEKAGADFIVMPCNSLHILAKRIHDSITIPFLSIIDETVKVLDKKDVKKVALLSTGQTVARKLYENPLKTVDIEVLKPTQAQQDQLNEMVVRLINGQEQGTDKKTFGLILESLQEQGAQIALLACTDFHIVYDENSSMEAVDTMEILAQATMREMLIDRK